MQNINKMLCLHNLDFWESLPAKVGFTFRRISTEPDSENNNKKSVCRIWLQELFKMFFWLEVSGTFMQLF